MPTVVKTIGSGAGRDFSTLAGWAASLPANLVSDGNSYEGDCYNDSEFVVTYTALTLSGNTTDANHTITLTTGAGQSFRDNPNVQSNALNYNAANGVGIRCTTNSAGFVAFDIEDANVTVSNLQIYQAGGSNYCVRVGVTGAVNVNNCIITGEYAFSGGADHVIRNCLIIGTGGNTEIVRDGFSPANGGASFYFCTIVTPSDATAPAYDVNSQNAVSSGQPLFENCAFFGCRTVYNDNSGSANPTFTTCMTDIASPPSGVTGGKSYANQFQNTTTASGDWRERSGADLQGAGTADSTNGANDIAATTRPQSGKWDVGCWELLGSGTIVSADAWVPIELLTMQGVDAPWQVEFTAKPRADSGMLLEHPGIVRADLGLVAEAMATQRADAGLPLEATATQRVDRWTPLELAAILRSDLGLAAELGGGVATDMAGQVESSARAFTDRRLVTEWLASSLCDVSTSDEFAAAVAGDGLVPPEWLGVISALLNADAVLPLEWSALSAPVLVSLERLRSSPGKRRFLGTPGRLRLLKRS